MDIITGCQLYWLTRCDEIKALLEPGFGWGLFWFVSTIALLISTIAGTATEGSPETSEDYYIFRIATAAKRISKPVCIVFSAFILLGATISALIPTTKEMAAIVVIPAVANSESVQGLGEGIVNLAKDWMVELSPKKVSKEELKNKVAGAVDATVKTAKAVNELATKDEKNNGSAAVGK